MGRGRLEAFSDGVLAIIITIMVLELRSPEGEGVVALLALAPIFLSYVLSFLYIGIYWNNHHHLLQACGRVSSGVLWANLHLLFWLSLVPFATRWIGENHDAAVPTAVYVPGEGVHERAEQRAQAWRQRFRQRDAQGTSIVFTNGNAGAAMESYPPHR